MTTENLPARMEYSKALAASDLLPRQYRNSPANVLVAVEYGRALGLEPMAAIQGIHVVEGKPTASAQLMGALVRRAGHILRVQGDDTHATATVRRKDDPEFEFTATWTLQRAAKAGLTSKAGSSWSKYPAAMLKARAISEVARDACPEVLAGMYSTEELDDATPGSPRMAPPPVPPVAAAPVVTVTREPEPTPAPEPEDDTPAPMIDYDTGEILDTELPIEDAVIVEEEPPTDDHQASLGDEPREPASKAQMAKLGALCNALGIDRDARLTFAGDVVGRTLGSANELSKAEASRVIDELDREVKKITPADV